MTGTTVKMIRQIQRSLIIIALWRSRWKEEGSINRERLSLEFGDPQVVLFWIAR
jgi:hypothetical protein